MSDKKTAASTFPEKKFNCPGVGWANTSSRWLAMYRFNGKGKFCGYANSEEDAIKIRDRKLIGWFGLRAETFFPREQYKNEFEKAKTMHINCGIANAEVDAPTLVLEIGDNNIFSNLLRETVKNMINITIVCNGMDLKIGSFKNETAVEKGVLAWFSSTGIQILEGYTNLREEAKSNWRSKPCEATYKILLFSHGACSTEELFESKLIKDMYI
eukprot:UN29679